LDSKLQNQPTEEEPCSFMDIWTTRS